MTYLKNYRKNDFASALESTKEMDIDSDEIAHSAGDSFHIDFFCRSCSFPNAYIAYRILLILHVTVVTAERSFLKLKLIKSYLRSTILQDRLNMLTILSIESEMLELLDYKNFNK
uniref:HAT C-terminal dimerisation domain-containing protein n=1 Tax=Cajanus cajan TaxID=3821 RepID=A0A151QQM7_CAJCA|nr:hypothetical protein KK1_046639 [Cajanus cajan]